MGLVLTAATKCHTFVGRQSRIGCATASQAVIVAEYKNYWTNQEVTAESVASKHCRTNRQGWLLQAIGLVELPQCHQKCRIEAAPPMLGQSTTNPCWKNQNRTLQVFALTWQLKSQICWWNPLSRCWRPAKSAAPPCASLTCLVLCSQSSILFPRHCFRFSFLWTGHDSYRL